MCKMCSVNSALSSHGWWILRGACLRVKNVKHSHVVQKINMDVTRSLERVNLGKLVFGVK